MLCMYVMYVWLLGVSVRYVCYVCNLWLVCMLCAYVCVYVWFASVYVGMLFVYVCNVSYVCVRVRSVTRVCMYRIF